MELVAAKMVDRSRDVVREAAAFHRANSPPPEADSYRALGNVEATAAEPTNMAWLMAWLHPDQARDGDSPCLFAVTGRNDLKTPDRRATCDAICVVGHCNRK